MKRPQISVLLLCALGMVIGVAGAVLLHFGTPRDSSVSTSSIGTVADSRITASNQPEESFLPGDIRDIDSLFSSIENTILQKDSFRLQEVIYSLVTQLTEPELAATLQNTIDTNAKLPQLIRYKLQRALIEKFAISNPREALNFALTHDIPQHLVEVSAIASMRIANRFALPPAAPIQTSLITTVFSVWAMSDLTVAIEQASDLNDNPRKLALDGILMSQVGASFEELREIAIGLGSEKHAIDAYLASFNIENLEDPRFAWEEVSSHANTRDESHEWVLKNVVLSWYEQDGLDIVDEIQATETSATIKWETSRLVLLRALQDTPQSAFRHALKIPTDMRFGMPIASEVVRTWALTDPQAAYDILSEVEDQFLLDMLPAQVVSTWAWNDPNYVLDNIENFPPNLHQAATSSALGAIAIKAPQEAVERALNLRNRRERSRSISNVINIWVQTDLEAAVSWVQSGNRSEQNQLELASSLIDWIVYDDPQRAFDIARKETVLEWDDTGLEADVVRYIAEHRSVENAIELLAQVREGKTRAVATAEVAETLIGNGHTTRALQLGLDLPESEQVEFFPRIIEKWVSIDPDSFVESIEEIPPELQSKVVLKLFEKRNVNNYITSYIEQFSESIVETLTQYLTDEDRATIDEL